MNPESAGGKPKQAARPKRIHRPNRRLFKNKTRGLKCTSQPKNVTTY